MFPMASTGGVLPKVIQPAIFLILRGIDKPTVQLWKDRKLDGFISHRPAPTFTNLSIAARWATMLVTAATLLCGIAAADTIVVPSVDTNAGENYVWLQENGQDRSEERRVGKEGRSLWAPQ